MKNERLFKVMEEEGVEVLVLCQPDNVAYASGFETILPYCAADALVNAPFSYAIVDGREKKVCVVAATWATKGWKGSFADEQLTFETMGFFELIEVKPDVIKVMREALSRYLRGAEVIGIEDMRLPVKINDLINEANPHAKKIDIQKLIDKAKLIKQPYEIERIKFACMVEDAGQTRLNRYATEFNGETEFEVHAEVVKAMNEAAGEKITLTGDFATGPRSNALWGVAGPIPRKIERGDSCIFDMSTRIRGYWCDCANSIVFGAEPNEEQKRYFKMVKAAFDAGFENLRPGKTFWEADKAASDAFRSFGKEPVVYTGHQIGTNVCDPPIIACYSDKEQLIEPNMVVCIEPQNYTGDEGTTGIRLEKVIHITEDGPVLLNSFAWGINC